MVILAENPQKHAGAFGSVYAKGVKTPPEVARRLISMFNVAGKKVSSESTRGIIQGAIKSLAAVPEENKISFHDAALEALKEDGKRLYSLALVYAYGAEVPLGKARKVISVLNQSEAELKPNSAERFAVEDALEVLKAQVSQ
jgi:hypothetical protein